MDINSIIDNLNNELEKLKSITGQSIDTNSFFTNDKNFNNDFSFSDSNLSEDIKDSEENKSINNIVNSSISFEYEDIEPDDETKSLINIRENRLISVQNMFKKSIRVSLKSFLISITLSFLNLFI